MPLSFSPKKAAKPAAIRLPSVSHGLGRSSGQKTPKTPQDEAVAFFSGASNADDVIQVWELDLEDDGGPSDKKGVRRGTCLYWRTCGS